MPKSDFCRTCMSRLYKDVPFVPRDRVGRKCGTCVEGSLMPTNYTRSRGIAQEPRLARVSMLCETCPLHLEKGLYPGITRMGGKPLHCSTNKTCKKGCYDMRQRAKKLAVYYRILEANEVKATEGVLIHA